MPTKFGDLVIEFGYITTEQLKHAMEVQKKGKIPLGFIMKRQGTLTDSQVDHILEHQKSEEGKGKVFGKCAVILGLIIEDDLITALKYQEESPGVLGEILIKLGFMTNDQRDEILQDQLLR